MPGEESQIIISKYNSSKLEKEINNMNMLTDIKVHNFGNNERIVVYNGFEFLYDQFLREFSKTELNEDIVKKKGSSDAPGMFKLGSLENKNYKSPNGIMPRFYFQ